MEERKDVMDDEITSILAYVPIHYAHGSPTRKLAAEVEHLRETVQVRTEELDAARARVAELEAAEGVNRDALDAWMRARNLMLISNSYFADLISQLAAARQTATQLHVDHARLAELEALAGSVRESRAGLLAGEPPSEIARKLLYALDAVPAAETTSGGGTIPEGVRVIRAHRLDEEPF